MSLGCVGMKCKILIFTEGTLLMHKIAVGHSRKEIVKQVKTDYFVVHDYASYIPIGDCVKRLFLWKKKGAKIMYLTSRRKKDEIVAISSVLKKYNFPKGKLVFRVLNESYGDVVERIIPDVLIEYDCESIGGTREMTIYQVAPTLRKKIKSIVVKEFEGIDSLPDYFKIGFNTPRLAAIFCNPILKLEIAGREAKKCA